MFSQRLFKSLFSRIFVVSLVLQRVGQGKKITCFNWQLCGELILSPLCFVWGVVFVFVFA